ncbi:hypothetical protein K5I29_08355 [Flavobacterium agricola]|uniref:Uncharacterized protein n=1 Tax=Flavobacterium agricola TaxID=2870839 RepID=A0ABY6LYP7_9FLAO|nr:hypothetical protein [Flavobacterium agricola]UYW00555.1 hypothetical protein K5I29_08355 [Flavobacterium agricola]
MMKLFLNIILCSLFYFSSQAQIGINFVPNPNEVNNSPLIIKTDQPNALRFVPEGTEPLPGQVLISDDEGNVRYGDLTATEIDFVNGVFNGGVNAEDLYRNNKVFDSNAYIDLPPGRWAVNFSIKFQVVKYSTVNETTENLERDEAIWARIILSNTSGNTTNYNTDSTKDIAIPNLYLASGSLVGPTQYTNVKGEIYILNSLTTTKRYYLKVFLEKYNLDDRRRINYKLIDFAAGPILNGVDRFFAIPAN